MFAPYRPRPIEFLGVEQCAGYRVKVYSIRYGELNFDRECFHEAWELTSAVLPQPAVASERPGVGFAIMHQGRTGAYFVLCWWDRENELPTRVYLSDGAGWRPAAAGESFCVWDLQVMGREREAYVTTVLAGRDDGVELYLATTKESST
jgi:hypothetical protein